MRRTVGWWMGARTHVIIASRSSSNSADALSSGTHGKSASAHAPAATRPRASEKLLHCLSRATHEAWTRSRVGDGATRRNGVSTVSARARSRCERVDNTVNTRVARNVARHGREFARLGPDVPNFSRFQHSRPRKYSKKPRRGPSGRRDLPVGDRFAARTDSGRGARHRSAGRRLFDAGRIARPRAAARPRKVTAEANEQTAPSATNIAAVGVFVRGEATRRVSSRAMRRGRTRGRLRAVPSGRRNRRRERRARALGERRRVRLCVGRAFFKPFVEFCREKFVRASFSVTPRATAPWHLTEDFFAASPSKFDV